MNYVKVNKPTARKLFREGKTIHLFPCKVDVENPWEYGGVQINKEKDHDTFDHLVNQFEQYHCYSDVGYYAKYFVKEGDYQK